MDLIDRVAPSLTRILPPAPDGMHWSPTVTRDDEGDDVRLTVTWRLLPTLVFED